MRLVRYFLGGTSAGVALGFYIGYRYNRAKIRAEAFEESEAEIQSIREHYRQKETAKENAEGKEELAGLVVRERYASEEEAEVEQTGDVIDLSTRPLRPPVPLDPAKRIFRSTEASKDKMDGWNFPSEMTKRTSDRPYIIHQDEF